MIFDKLALVEAITAAVPTGSKLMDGLITYKDTPKLRYVDQANPFLLDYDLVRRLGLQEAVAKHVLKHHRSLFFEKASDWRDEREYRWVLWDNTLDHHKINFGSALKGVVVGSEFPPAVWRLMQDRCAEHRVLVKKMTWRNGAPELEHQFHNRRSDAKASFSCPSSHAAMTYFGVILSRGEANETARFHRSCWGDRCDAPCSARATGGKAAADGDVPSGNPARPPHRNGRGKRMARLFRRAAPLGLR